MRSPTLLKCEIIDVFYVKYTFKPKNVVSFWGIRSPYLLPGSSPDLYLGFAPESHGDFSPPDPLFCGVPKNP